MTIHGAKGLEFPAVIVSAVDQLPNPMDPDEVRDSNLLYVALTSRLKSKGLNSSAMDSASPVKPEISSALDPISNILMLQFISDVKKKIKKIGSSGFKWLRGSC